LYVDDTLIASKSRSAIYKLKKDLSSEFEMKDFGEVKMVLGMEIKRDWKSGKISLTQKGYLKKVLQKFNINDDTNSVSTPLAPHFKFKATMSLIMVEKHECMTHVPYASVVDSLMYTMVCTRPDLSQAVSIVSRYMHDHERGHCKVVKWILRYIKGTIDIDLILKKDVAGKQKCIGYVESEYTRDLDKRRSTTGYVFTLSQVPVS